MKSRFPSAFKKTLLENFGIDVESNIPEWLKIFFVSKIIIGNNVMLSNSYFDSELIVDNIKPENIPSWITIRYVNPETGDIVTDISNVNFPVFLNEYNKYTLAIIDFIQNFTSLEDLFPNNTKQALLLFKGVYKRLFNDDSIDDKIIITSDSYSVNLTVSFPTIPSQVTLQYCTNNDVTTLSVSSPFRNIVVDSQRPLSNPYYNNENANLLYDNNVLTTAYNNKVNLDKIRKVQIDYISNIINFM